MEGLGMNGQNQPHQVRNQQQSDNQQGQAPPQPQPQPQPAAAPRQPRKWYEPTIESKIVVIILMLAAVVVLLTFLASLFHDRNTVSDFDFVQSDQFQAAFLNNGQVYFGNITGGNDDMLIMENVYYLQVDQQLQPEEEGAPEDPQVSLAKLGNELHGPEDQMFINRDEITFWENLREDGQVSQAISQHDEQGEGQGGNSLGEDEVNDELPGNIDSDNQTGQDPAESENDNGNSNETDQE